MTQLNEISETLVKGDRDLLTKLVHEALKEGVPADVILKQGLIAGMDVVGAKFQEGELFIPHMLLAARAMHTVLDILRPVLMESGSKPAGRVLLGTVRGDHHDIGKNLVGMMLEGKGFEVVDLGIDVPPEKFVSSLEDGVNIVAMSALLSTTAPELQYVIEALKKAGVRDRVKVMVGGGVVTQSYADSIGADAYGQDAAEAAAKALALVS